MNNTKLQVDILVNQQRRVYTESSQNVLGVQQRTSSLSTSNKMNCPQFDVSKLYCFVSQKSKSINARKIDRSSSRSSQNTKKKEKCLDSDKSEEESSKLTSYSGVSQNNKVNRSNNHSNTSQDSDKLDQSLKSQNHNNSSSNNNSSNHFYSQQPNSNSNFSFPSTQQQTNNSNNPIASNNNNSQDPQQYIALLQTNPPLRQNQKIQSQPIGPQKQNSNQQTKTIGKYYNALQFTRPLRPLFQIRERKGNYSMIDLNQKDIQEIDFKTNLQSPDYQPYNQHVITEENIINEPFMRNIVELISDPIEEYNLEMNKQTIQSNEDNQTQIGNQISQNFQQQTSEINQIDMQQLKKQEPDSQQFINFDQFINSNQQLPKMKNSKKKLASQSKPFIPLPNQDLQDFQQEFQKMDQVYSTPKDQIDAKTNSLSSLKKTPTTNHQTISNSSSSQKLGGLTVAHEMGSIVSTDTTHDSDNFTTQKSTSSLGIDAHGFPIGCLQNQSQQHQFLQQQQQQQSLRIYGFHGLSEPRITHNQRIEKIQQSSINKYQKSEAFRTYNNMNTDQVNPSQNQQQQQQVYPLQKNTKLPFQQNAQMFGPPNKGFKHAQQLPQQYVKFNNQQQNNQIVPIQQNSKMQQPQTPQFLTQQNNLDYLKNTGYDKHKPSHQFPPPKGKKSESINADNHNYDINIDKLDQDCRTTVMIRNIPNKYSADLLMNTIDQNHYDKYDFFYLPIDKDNNCNVGYAFINFVYPAYIREFVLEFDQKRWQKFNSDKTCQIKYARIQGRDELNSHFRDSNVMNSKEKKCKPIFLPEQKKMLQNILDKQRQDQNFPDPNQQ